MTDAEEKALVDAYLDARVKEEQLAGQCMEHFMPLARTALARDDSEEALKVAHRCPDCVARCFILDAIRQHRLGGNKK